MRLDEYKKQFISEIKRQVAAIYKSDYLNTDLWNTIRYTKLGSNYVDLISTPEDLDAYTDFEIVCLDYSSVEINNKPIEVITIKCYNLYAYDYDCSDITLPVCFGDMTDDEIVEYCNNLAKPLYKLADQIRADRMRNK